MVRSTERRDQVRPLPGGLHGHPPLTPAAVLLKYRATVPLLLTLFVAGGIVASYERGEIALHWDEPIQRWVMEHRTETLDTVMKGISQLGGLTFVAAGLIVLLFLVYERCHALGIVLLTAVIARPPLEWLLKAVVDRPRPDFDQLVPGVGPSYPTGHVMAAIAFWGLVPPVVALLTHRRALWWASSAISGTIVLLVGASRIYLGVHWFTDVIGAFVVGSVYLLGVEYLLEWHHDRRGCQPLDEAEADLLSDRPHHPHDAVP